jgi:hypothetical protein
MGEVIRKLMQGKALFTTGLIAGHYLALSATAQDDRLTRGYDLQSRRGGVCGGAPHRQAL